MAGDIQKNVTSHAQRDMATVPTASHDAPNVQQAKEQARKIGEGHAMAMLRLGFKELAQTLTPLPDSNIRPMEEPGVFGNENAPQRVLEESHDDRLTQFANRGMGQGRGPERDR